MFSKIAMDQKHDLPWMVMPRRHSSLSPVISPQRLYISSGSSIATHIEILGISTLALQRKRSLPFDIHRINIPSTTSSKLRLCQPPSCSQIRPSAYSFTVSMGCLASSLCLYLLCVDYGCPYARSRNQRNTVGHPPNLPVLPPGRSHQ